ncbi:hypothetical protein [Defluviimonas sp. SAOS-178_SWC]|uniref:hypothetical protein n=1 Tax=Defluviimonas sp. SAOS-178_SWC TaxID=3121287 RepID=UPI0032218E69
MSDEKPKAKAQGVGVVTTSGKQTFTRADCIRLGLDPTAYGYKKASAAELAGSEDDAE